MGFPLSGWPKLIRTNLWSPCEPCKLVKDSKISTNEVVSVRLKNQRRATQADLAKGIADRLNIPRTQAVAALQAVGAEMAKAVKGGAVVALPGVGTIVPTLTPGGKRKVFGKAVTVLAKYGVTLRPEQGLREAVAGRKIRKSDAEQIGI